jgi:hypothetical protein
MVANGSVAVAQTNACAEPSFALLPGIVAVGDNPQAIAAGDFDGDGKTDLAVANRSSGNVSILLGKGDGTFQTAVKFGAGFQPSSVALGDFNGDGKTDLGIANNVYSNSTVSVLLGNGDGSFQASVSYATEPNSRSVAVGDFNGDAKPDLAVVGWNSDKVSVLLGNGDGTFQAALRYHAAIAPSIGLYSVAVGDFNGDSKPDLAFGDSVLLGNGDGTFQTARYYGANVHEKYVTVGDFNGDGQSDVAMAGYGTGVSVLLGNGDGSFQTAIPLRTGPPAALTAGDFNCDGKMDLALADDGSPGRVRVALGNGDGTFRAPVGYGGWSGPLALGVDDFNGDGKPDLVVAGFFSFFASVLLNTCGSAAPELAVVRNDTHVHVSWPVPHFQFLLESATNLGPNNWHPAAEACRTNNARLEVTIPCDGQERYFRLRQQ